MNVWYIFLTRWFLFYFSTTDHDEWAEVVKDPERRAKFRQFANTDKTIGKDEMVDFIDMRGQQRPADWPKDGEPQTMWKAPDVDIFAKSEKSWVRVGSVSDFAPNVGTPILYSDTQLAVFNNANRGEWYCTQNMCPHKQAFVLSQGLVGDSAGTPKVACPLHKKQFSLEDGLELGAEEPLSIITFPIKVEGDDVFVELPAEPEVDAILGTHGLRVTQSDCIDIAGDALKVSSRFDKMMGAGQKLVDTVSGRKSSSTVLQAKSTNSTSTDA